MSVWLKTRSAAWPSTADRRTLASAATAATSFSPGFEVTQDLRVAHAARLEVIRYSGAQASQKLPAQLDREFLGLAKRDQKS